MKRVSLLVLILLAGQLISSDYKTEAKVYLQTLNKPKSVEEFAPLPHLAPLDQDTTNACWSFSTLSFIESEVIRKGGKPLKLSMMFPVYWGFVEKARYFVHTQGASRFSPGDLFSGVTEIIKKYGIVPHSIYKGQTRSCKTFNHQPLEQELQELMKRIKHLKLWDEALVVKRVREILDTHLGPPPNQFVFEGKQHSALSFRRQYVNLNWDDYITLTSFQYAPFYQFIQLQVPDNWKQYNNFYNLPLDIFYATLIHALQNGYSAAFDSDTGEPGRMGSEDAVFVPPFDIPGSYITQNARELRFKSGATTDDHLMHFTGYKQFDSHDWFLVKDSWRTAWDGQHKGYYFFHGDYIRLKVLAYIIPKAALRETEKRLLK